MDQSDVCVIGNNTIDIVFAKSSEIKIGEKINAERLDVFGGGQAANTAFTLAAIGLRVRYIGCFGDDQNGVYSRQTLTDIGIDTSNCPTVPNCPNHVATIIVNTHDHDRTIIMYKDPRLAVDNLRFDKSWLTNVRAVYTDGHEPKMSRTIARVAQSKGISVMTDLESVQPDLRGLLKSTSTLIAPLRIILEVSKEIEETIALSELSKLGPPLVVATKGIQGSVCKTKDNEFISAPANTCNTVDTTGAGDAFHAGFLAAQLRGLDEKESLIIGSQVAALKCECFGPRLSGQNLKRVGTLLPSK